MPPPERVTQCLYRVPKENKRHLLAHLIQDGNWQQVLVFTRTKHGANRLAKQLEGAGIATAAIHGNKSQNARVRALEDFKSVRITALVATEVAARGLDIKELPHVVNYELPNVPEDYVHRIGRTARAGASGSAVSLVASDEEPLLRDIERL
ncbi:DEAD/DEAH box helicase domain protein, partial [mine drainage metagenome]